MNERVAMFWETCKNGTVNCTLCPHNCNISNNAVGLCGVRKNIDGKLYAIGYGRVSSAALDPIEKKPLYMFYPGEKVFSIGGLGCNFSCPFCQNHEISMEHNVDAVEIIQPGYIVSYAQQAVYKGNIGLAYTYNEPFIGYEFMYDCAKLIRDCNLVNVVVTNGFINSEPLEKLLPLIDAMNIDLKCFNNDFYNKLGGNLEAVKQTIMQCYNRCHLEITTLVIPGENENDIDKLASWLASVDINIPLHLTRFYPRYFYSDKKATARESLFSLKKVAMKYLNNVFVM